MIEMELHQFSNQSSDPCKSMQYTNWMIICKQTHEMPCQITSEDVTYPSSPRNDIWLVCVWPDTDGCTKVSILCINGKLFSIFILWDLRNSTENRWYICHLLTPALSVILLRLNIHLSFRLCTTHPLARRNWENPRRFVRFVQYFFPCL